MKTYAMVSADLGFLFLGIIMVILVCVLPMVQQESLSFIEVTKAKKQSDITAPDVRETMLVELVYQANGKADFYVTEPKGKKNHFTSTKKVVDFMLKKMPQDVRMRVDRRVPHGVSLDIALPAQEKGIRVWEVSERG